MCIAADSTMQKYPIFCGSSGPYHCTQPQIRRRAAISGMSHHGHPIHGHQLLLAHVVLRCRAQFLLLAGKPNMSDQRHDNTAHKLAYAEQRLSGHTNCVPVKTLVHGQSCKLGVITRAQCKGDGPIKKHHLINGCLQRSLQLTMPITACSTLSHAAVELVLSARARRSANDCNNNCQQPSPSLISCNKFDTGEDTAMTITTTNLAARSREHMQNCQVPAVRACMMKIRKNDAGQVSL